MRLAIVTLVLASLLLLPACAMQRGHVATGDEYAPRAATYSPPATTAPSPREAAAKQELEQYAEQKPLLDEPCADGACAAGT